MQKTLIEGISNPKDLEDFLKSQEKFNKKEGSLAKIKPKEHHFREFTTEKGLKIYVGKNDKDNERLTFIYGRGSDFWLHAADYPGSHVLLKLDKEKAPDEETLLDAMQLALYFSQARKAGAGEVTITQCKYLSKVKRGQIGQVNVSKNKTAYVRLDAMRLQRLLGRPPLF